VGEYTRALALLDESLATSRARGDGHAVAYTLREVAILRQIEGDVEEAITLLRECLASLKPLKDVRCTHHCLVKLAELLGGRSYPTDVARLFGATQALRERSGGQLSQDQRLSYVPALAAVEQQLDSQSFAAAWAAGRAMTLEQAITLALNETVPT
jgi:hypothetical protein